MEKRILAVNEEKGTNTTQINKMVILMFEQDVKNVCV